MLNSIQSFHRAVRVINFKTMSENTVQTDHLHHEVHNKLKLNIRVGGNSNKYPAKSHARRIAEKLGIPDGLIILAATRAANWPNSDMPAPFRQDRYFYYLTGCNEADCFTTYDIKKDTLALWLPPIDEDRVVWYGRGSTIDEALEKYDIDEAHYYRKKPKVWSSAQGDALSMFCQEHVPHATCPFAFTLGSNIYSTSEQQLRQAIDSCRVIKDDYEIDLIRKANVITGEAHVEVMKGMHAFTSEADVEASYMKVCIAQRAKVQAYDPIAGSGRNAAELHYSANDEDFGSGQTVVLDAGCEVERYASDVTRTLPINRRKPGHWPSKEAEEIYDLVEKMQESCIKQMVPGKQFIEVFWLSHYMVIDGLLKLGILKGDRDEIFHTGTSRAFLPHGLGHHVGLEVHDVSPVPHPPLPLTSRLMDDEQSDSTKILPIDRTRLAFSSWNPDCATKMSSLHQPMQPQIYETSHSGGQLEPGMVVTVEPGIYFNDFLIKHFFLSKEKHRKFIVKDVLDRYMQVGGVRIEDDILITKKGYENLTTAPKGKKMLEIMRESAGKAASRR